MRPISEHSFQIIMLSIDHIFYLNIKLKQVFRNQLYEIDYKKGTKILLKKQVQKYVWFMVDGLAREVKTHNKSRIDRTVWFWTPSSYIYTSPGFFSQTPSESVIEILIDSTLVLMDYQDWYLLKDEHKDIEQLTEMIRGSNDKIRIQHAEDIAQLSTTQRYLKYKDTLKILFPLTKLKYVAEFMGMSSDTLGKLRSKF